VSPVQDFLDIQEACKDKGFYFPKMLFFIQCILLRIKQKSTEGGMKDDNKSQESSEK
jgi:hypothetical protein